MGWAVHGDQLLRRRIWIGVPFVGAIGAHWFGVQVMRTSAAGRWLVVGVVLVGCAAPRVFKANSSPLPSQSAQPPSDGDPASLAPQSGVSSPPPVGSHAAARVGTTVVGCPDPALVSDGGAVTPLLSSTDVVAVVRCETVTRTYPGVGSWTVQLAEVANASLSEFVDQLRQPSDPPSTGVACPLFRIAIPWFVVVAKGGTVVHPSIPTTGCGQPKTPAISALSALVFREVAAVRVQQMSASGG